MKFSDEEMQEALDVIILDDKEDEICECIKEPCQYAIEKYFEHQSERTAMLECIAELAGALSNIGPTLDAMHDEWCEALDLPPHQPTLEEIERAKTALTRAEQFLREK